MASRQLSEAQREAADRARRETVEQLHQQLADHIANLDDKDAWERWLNMASRLHRYSMGNVALVLIQCPEATMVAGYRAWQAMGHQVRRGEKAIKILGPVTRKVELVDRMTGESIRDAEGRPQYVRQMTGVRPVSVFDASQVDPPVEFPPEPKLLQGEAPPGLWDSLAELAATEGFTLSRGGCGGANGWTDFVGREIRVRDDIDDAQSVKVLCHELGHADGPADERNGQPGPRPLRGLRLDAGQRSGRLLPSMAHRPDLHQRRQAGRWPHAAYRLLLEDPRDRLRPGRLRRLPQRALGRAHRSDPDLDPLLDHRSP